MSATRIIELVEEHKGVPASDGAFDRKLLLAAQDLHAWQFASSLEQIVRRYPTPRGWAIAGYALANAGLLKQAIACLKKGRQMKTPSPQGRTFLEGRGPLVLADLSTCSPLTPATLESPLQRTYCAKR